MAASETAKLVASLSLKDQFSAPLKSAGNALNKFDTHLATTQTRVGKGAAQITAGVMNAAKLAVVGFGAVTGLLLASAKEGQEAAKVQNLYAAAIANSGKVSAAQVTALNAQQLALMNLTGADDELIKSEQTRLIQMGLTGDAVAKLTPLIADVVAATGKDQMAVTVAVGKAVAGNATALQKLGIIVPKMTKAEAAASTEGSRLANVTGALTKGFGGAAAAISGGLDVKLQVLNQSLANVRESAGQKLLPAMIRIVDVVAQKLVPAFGTFIDAILPTAIAGLDKLASFLEGGGATSAITSFLNTAKAVMPVIQRGAEITGSVIKTAVDLFRSLPPEIQSLAVAGLAINKLTGGLVTNLAGGLISAVISGFKGLMNVNAAVVNVNGPVGGVPSAAGAAGAAATGLSGLQKVFLVGEAIGLAVAVNQVRQGVSDQSTAQATAINEQTQKFIASQPPPDQLKTALDAVNTGIHDLEFNPLNVLVQGDALTTLRGMRTDLQAQIAARKTPGNVQQGMLGNVIAGKATQGMLGNIHLPAAAKTIGTLSDTKLIAAIKTLQRDQKQLLQHGGAQAKANAKAIAANITRMKDELKRRQDAAAAKIAAATKAAGVLTADAIRNGFVTTNVTVPVTVTNVMNGRTFTSTVRRFESTQTSGARVGGA